MLKKILTIGWIITALASISGASAAQKTKPSVPADSGEKKEESRFQRFRYDFGMSTGTSSGSTFYEGNLGLSYFFFEWLSWRNAPFVRIQTNKDTNYGLDSSVRGNYGIGIEDLKVNILGGGGYRFQNLHSHVPFAETGLGVRVGQFHLNGTAKILLYSWINTSQKNEMVYTISAGGSGSAF